MYTNYTIEKLRKEGKVWKEGQRVRHKISGRTGTILVFNQTYFPTIDMTYYHLLVRSDDGEDWKWTTSGRSVEVVADK
jgi:hypothetical protein